MSRHQRQQRRRRKRGTAAGKVLLGVSVLIGTLLLAVLVGVGYIANIAASAPSIDTLKPVVAGSPDVIYAADGTRLGFIKSDQLRQPLRSSQIPQVLKDATVAIEDQRFYDHKGVDYEGVIRAAFKNLTSGKTVQGGSTITMQLVRNLYIRNPKRDFQRKIREAKLAQELEQEHNKAWILDQYLNSVSYGTVNGQTAVGVQAAARTIFAKQARRLTLPEAALLAGLPQAPSEYNPFKAPDRALARRNEVLRKMRQLGKISSRDAAAALAAPLGVKLGTYYTRRKENYFFDYVRDELISRYGVNTVQQGGLKVHTTIDLGLQQAARAAITGRLKTPGDPSAAIVSVDPRNGYIRAMASSGAYGKSQFNLAAQGHRRAGSTFKVMVLMAALRQGVDPNRTSYASKELNIPLGFGQPWHVQTYDHSYGGVMNLVRATLRSDNTIYAQLDLDVGPDAVKKAAQDMGITSKLYGYPAEGLGGLKYGVSPLEMANAYATIASGGWRNKPIAIKRVEFADGRSEDLGKPDRTKAFSDGVAYEATKILHQNVLGGTGTAANYGCPAAGKTGTVDDFTDAWFVGYTPRLSTATWMGYPGRQIPMHNIEGVASVNGGSLPAGIWHDYMVVAHRGFCGDFSLPKEPFRPVPFFGKYATTGAPITPTATAPSAIAPAKTKPNGKTKGGKGTKGFDPGAYESPPQAAPKTLPPPSGGGAPSGGASPKPAN